MTIAIGIERYNVDSKPVVARGNSYTAKELGDALKGPVAELIRDDAGNKDVKDLLIGLAETGFQNRPPIPPADWWPFLFGNGHE